MVKLGGAELPLKRLSLEPQPNSISAGHDAQSAVKFVGKNISKPSPLDSMFSVYFTILYTRCENYCVKWMKSRRTYLLRLSAVSSCWIYQQWWMSQIVLKEIPGAGWHPSLLVHSHNCGPFLWLLALPSEQSSLWSYCHLHTWAVGNSSRERDYRHQMRCAGSIGASQGEQASSMAYMWWVLPVTKSLF